MKNTTKKLRLDRLLVERGLALTVDKARALILARSVKVEGESVDRADAKVPIDADIAIKGTDTPYVSRGGLKLRGALDHFALGVEGRVVIDVGASTGGFTDCLLQAGAKKVYALDVGYGQLAWKIRQDPRVVVIERTNIRHYDGRDFDERPSLAVIDVSFISLKTVLPAVAPLLAGGGLVLALIKPQFEARREEVGPDGVISDESVQRRVMDEIRDVCPSVNLDAIGMCESPITGPAGNREFFILAKAKDA
ncbi:MAG TPA: TlyA family RNA methyltransferase [Smithellaceae bacterium]|nr:TlyA family RNA methyltransferase [Smithellaceae bacterium]